MKILIADDDSDIRDILMFTFDSELDAEYLYAGSGKEAIEHLEAQKDINLIICDYNMPNGNGGTVYRYLLENQLDIPYVLCSSALPDEMDDFQDKTYLIDNIVKPHVYEGVQKTLASYENYMKSKENSTDEIVRRESKYAAVKIDLLKACGTMPCDIFVKINEQKFLKVLNKDSAFSDEDYERYKQKNISKLIVEKEVVKDFVNVVCDKIIKILQGESGDKEDKVLDAHAVIMDTISSLGLSDQVIRATEKSVEFALGIFKKNKNFKSIYKHIFGHGGKYLTKHSITLAYITNALVAKTPWDSPDTRNKLVLASFFHDVTIKVPDLDESLIDDLEDYNLKNFKDHPMEASELVKKFKGIPPDLDRIILDHHERPDGTGLPRGLSGTQIQALSALFIFSHDVVDCIFKLEKSDDQMSQAGVQVLLDEELYQVGHFKKCYQAYEKINLFG